MAAHKLAQLLKLADQGPALRAALAEEVADLLTHWPAGYPENMKSVCEALLAKAAHDVDAATRARLRVRLFADPELAARVLPRESLSQAVIEAARGGDNDGVVAALSQLLGVDDAMTRQILDDETGAALAVACKGANLDRAAFSALVLMARPGRDRAHAYAVLDTFDSVPMSEASRLLRGWRSEEAGPSLATA